MNWILNLLNVVRNKYIYKPILCIQKYTREDTHTYKKVGIVSCSLEHAMSYGYEEDYSDMEQLMVLLPS